MKITANNIVAIEPYKAPFLFPWIKEWWAYVTVTKSQNNRLFMLLSMELILIEIFTLNII